MWVDDKITNEFVRGDITSQAYKTYLRSQMEREATKPKLVVEHYSSFKEKASNLLDAVVNGNLYADNWERQFLRDNVDNDTPSEAQINRMEKMWKRFRTREESSNSA